MSVIRAYLTRMPVGIPGEVSRQESAKIEPAMMDSAYPVLAYGLPVKEVSGKVRPLAGGETAADIRGFLVRPYPQQSEVVDVAGATTPVINLPCDVLRSGYMTVNCQEGTPAKGGQVYARIAAASPDIYDLSGVEATYAAGENIAITGCKFMGTADANGNVEIEYNL